MFYKIFSDRLKVISRNNAIHTFTRLYQNHYDVLNLPKNCTSKQIKNAYIKLSKKYHPDINKNKQSHVKFQQISEAYNVLGKPESRRNYDLGLAGYSQARTHYNKHFYYKQTTEKNPYDDPSFWENRDRKRDEFYRSRGYYGIDGVPRLSNATIMGLCAFFAIIGVGIQYLAITKSVTFKREVLIRRSQEAEKVLKDSRDEASLNGNDQQLENLKQRLLGQLKETGDE